MKINFSQVVVLSYVTSLIALFGCIQPKTKATTEDGQLGINVGIKNVGNERIDLAYVRFGDYTFRAGIVSAGSRKVNVDSGQSVPDRAEVGYELTTGKSIVQSVDVKRHMPTNSTDNMALYFIIDGERPVTVEFMRFVQVDGSWTLKHYDE